MGSACREGVTFMGARRGIGQIPLYHSTVVKIPVQNPVKIGANPPAICGVWGGAKSGPVYLYIPPFLPLPQTGAKSLAGRKIFVEWYLGIGVDEAVPAFGVTGEDCPGENVDVVLGRTLRDVLAVDADNLRRDPPHKVVVLDHLTGTEDTLDCGLCRLVLPVLLLVVDGGGVLDKPACLRVILEGERLVLVLTLLGELDLDVGFVAVGHLGQRHLKSRSLVQPHAEMALGVAVAERLVGSGDDHRVQVGGNLLEVRHESVGLAVVVEVQAEVAAGIQHDEVGLELTAGIVEDMHLGLKVTGYETKGKVLEAGAVIFSASHHLERFPAFTDRVLGKLRVNKEDLQRFGSRAEGKRPVSFDALVGRSCRYRETEKGLHRSGIAAYQVQVSTVEESLSFAAYERNLVRLGLKGGQVDDIVLPGPVRKEGLKRLQLQGKLVGDVRSRIVINLLLVLAEKSLLGDADIMHDEAVDGQLDGRAVAESGADVGQVHRNLTLDLAVGAAFLKVAVVHEVGPEPCQPLRERRGIGIRCQSFADGQNVNRLLCLEQVLCSKEYIRVARLLEVSGPYLLEDVFLLARITHQSECENKVA